MIPHTQQLDGLRKACGYIENGTSQAVTISQDDATKEWIAIIDGRKRYFYDKTFSGLLQQLAFAYKE